MHLQRISANDLTGFSTVREIRSYHQTIIYDKHDLKIEQQRDSLGMVFLICHAGRAVGTFRLVPTGHGLTLAEVIPNINELVSIPDSWEVQRFVISPDFRSLKNIMAIYREITTWLRDNTEITHVIAICNRRVAALLKRTGLKVLAKEIKLDNAHTDYFFLSGSVVDICNKLL
ncbi:MAG TPA: hypothetical protein ENJ28_02245 [Gammaproteobacteria bacterium]|nr:hypothetical protein [Gammaproteobacteria bacterium]